MNQVLETKKESRAVNDNVTRQRGVSRLDIAICLDGTDSMGHIIAGIIQSLMGFVEITFDGGLDVRIGLVIFRDETYGEETLCYELTDDAEHLKGILSRTMAKGGGDVPESALPAIRHALKLKKFRPDAQKQVLLITDAPPHDPEGGFSSEDALELLRSNHVVFSSCSPPIEPYTTFVNATQGYLFPITTSMSAEAFADTMLGVAHATVKTMRMEAGEISPDALDALRRTLRDEL